MGRSILLLVSGFIIIFGIIQNSIQNQQRILNERAPEYFYQEQSRNIAGAMLEIALGNSNNEDNYLTGNIMSTMQETSVEMLGGKGKIINVTPSNFNTRLEVKISGEIQKPDNTTVVTEIDAVFNRNPFSIYAYFTNSESSGIAFGSDDVLNGPVHTNGTFLFRGDPVFNGKITSPNSWEDDTNNNSSDPTFNGGSNFNTPNIDLPTEANEIVDLAVDDGLNFDEEIFLEFHGSENGNNNNGSGNDDDDDGDDDDGDDDGDDDNGNNNMAVCHDGNTIYVNSKSRNGHLKHGDSAGPCQGNNSGNNNSNTPSYNGNNDGTVEVSRTQRVCTFQYGSRCLRHEYQKEIIGTYNLSDFNGVISSSENVHIKGTVDGQITVHSKKDVRIAGDIIYENRNYDDNSEIISDDRLGIVSENETIVNRDAHMDQGVRDLYIDASILTMGDSFKVEDYNLPGWLGDTFGVRGTLNLLGGLIQRERGPVGTGNSSGVSTGYAKDYTYDTRFASSSTPGFPRRQNFDIESWRESTRTVKPGDE